MEVNLVIVFAISLLFASIITSVLVIVDNQDWEAQLASETNTVSQTGYDSEGSTTNSPPKKMPHPPTSKPPKTTTPPSTPPTPVP